MKQATLSVAYIALNEADNLPRSLQAIQHIADEIIVVDSGSADDTIAIAKRYGAKVIHQQWLGYAAQKNVALAACTQDFILSLDCDEVVTDRLLAVLKNVLRDPASDGYRLHRRTHYLGKRMDFSWQPDCKVRLVRRGAQPQWVGEQVHERLTVQGKVATLSRYLLHYSYRDRQDHLAKTHKYAALAAQAAFDANKPFRYRKLLLNPLIALLRMYIFRLGFLDGYRGWLAASSSFYYTWLKYWYLRKVIRQKRSC